MSRTGDEPHTEPAATGLGTCPIFLVKDVIAAAKYYQEKLGFTKQYSAGEPECFAIVRLGKAGIMLDQPKDMPEVRPNRTQGEASWDAHVLVDDARAYYEFCKASGATILIELREAPYGMVEFVAQDLDGYGIMFGQDL